MSAKTCTQNSFWWYKHWPYATKVLNIKWYSSECYDNDATALKTNNGGQKLVF